MLLERAGAGRVSEIMTLTMTVVNLNSDKTNPSFGLAYGGTFYPELLGIILYKSIHIF